MTIGNHMTTEELAAIKERAEKATAGPWEWRKYDESELDSTDDTQAPSLISENGQTLVMDFGDYEQFYPEPGSAPNEADAEFIANARQDIPALLAEVEHLLSVIKHLRCDECGDQFGDENSVGGTLCSECFGGYFD